MKKLFFSFAAICLCFVATCHVPHESDSQIVKEVVAAGAGDASGFTDPGLSQWFSKHIEVAKKIASECVPISRNPTATWIFTAEGEACHAAALVVAWTPKEYRADPRAW